MNYVKDMREKLNIEYVKSELIKTAYGGKETFLASLHPRTLIIWYLFFGIVPWFIHNKIVLSCFLVLMVVLTIMARVSPLIIVILCAGLLGEIGFLLLVSLVFGGGLASLLPMFWLTVKLAVIALASIAVFTSMDPERFSDALLSFGVPGQASFSVSFGYRILPTLVEEFQRVFLSYRLRGKAPETHGIFYWRTASYYLKLLVLSFYPLILNSAKRSRTTVEALETKGFSYSFTNAEVKKMKLAHLTYTYKDPLFLIGTVAYISFAFWLGTFIS
ncbi:energy-coupling factor transport system permease protein [Sporosarcina luteola]|nr:energy-coupling factor transport system permease protein [Sporosarcina luteola]